MTRRTVNRLAAFAATVVVCGALVDVSLAIVPSHDPVADEDAALAVFWSLPALLALAGAMWPVHRGAGLGAIVAVCACAIALVAYFGWTARCPDCSQGDFHRSTVFTWTWQFIALVSISGIAIVALAAAASSLAVHVLRPLRARRVTL